MQFVMAIIVVVWLITKCSGPEDPAKVRDREASYEKSRQAEETLRRNREEGAKALDEWDAAIRTDTADRKKRLQAAAIAHKVDTSGTRRIDIYTMRDGRIILCNTKITDSGSFMQCDGEP